MLPTPANVLAVGVGSPSSLSPLQTVGSGSLRSRGALPATVLLCAGPHGVGEGLCVGSASAFGSVMRLNSDEHKALL